MNVGVEIRTHRLTAPAPLAVISTCTELVLDRPLQFLHRAVDCQLHGGRFVVDGNGADAGESRFHETALVVAPTLDAVEVVQVDLNAGDPVAVPLQRITHERLHAPGELRRTGDVVIAVHLNLHGTSSYRTGYLLAISAGPGFRLPCSWTKATHVRSSEPLWRPNEPPWRTPPPGTRRI